MTPYGVEFDKLHSAHLAATRGLRRKAWHDQELHDEDPLKRAVYGLTGSDTVLDEQQRIAEQVAKNIGQPVLHIESYFREKRVRVARGGIISGEVQIAASFNNAEPGGGYGELVLHAPVEPYFGREYDERGGSMPAFTITGTDTIAVSKVVNHENRNRFHRPHELYRPEDDFAVVENMRVFIGREAIYNSEYFPLGLNQALLDLEKMTA